MVVPPTPPPIQAYVDYLEVSIQTINIFLDTPALSTLYPPKRERKQMFYLTTHSTHFIYGYMASDIWLRTIVIVRRKPAAAT